VPTKYNGHDFCLVLKKCLVRVSVKIHPSTHVRRYSPLWVLTSLKKRHSISLSCRFLHFHISRICNASLCATSFHLILDLPQFPINNLFWDPFNFHSYEMTNPHRSNNFNINQDKGLNILLVRYLYEIKYVLRLSQLSFFLLFQMLATSFGLTRTSSGQYL